MDGQLIISADSANHVEANSIALGGNKSNGTLTFGGGSMIVNSITRGPGTANFNWSGGTLTVGTFGSASFPFTLNNADAGMLAPGLPALGGATVINGGYSQGIHAATTIDIGGNTPGVTFDQVQASGAAALSGILSLNLFNNFTPQIGDQFDILTYASRTGQFTKINPPSLPANLAFTVDYTTDPTKLTLRIVPPKPANWVASAAVTSWGAPANWDASTTPNTDWQAILANPTLLPQQVSVSTDSTIQSLRLSASSAAAPLTLRILDGITLSASNSINVGPDATIDLANGKLRAQVVHLEPGSNLIGRGTISGSLVNDGILNVTGPLTIVNLPDASGNSTSGRIDGTGKTAVAATLAAAAIRQDTLSIDGTVLLKPSHGDVSRVNTLNIAGGITPTALLDLADGTLIVQPPPGTAADALTQISAQIAHARNTNGLWQGKGITSSAAAIDAKNITGLAAIRNIDSVGGKIYASFNAEPVDTDSILIKYTFNGDMDLNGRIDADDYFQIDNGFLAGLSGYRNGDLNYDGKIDADDYFLIDNAFANQTGVVLAAGQQASAAVPEPSLIALALPLLAGVVLRRRR